MLIVIFTVSTIFMGIGLFLENGMVGSGIGALLIAIILAIAVISARSESDYKEMALERKKLIRRLVETGGANNETLYAEVMEFNDELRKIKRDAGSIFTNWVTNQKIAALDYIDIPD